MMLSMSSGLGGLLDAARAFAAEVRFAQPRALWLLLLLPLLGLLNRWAAARRRRAVARIGRPGAVSGQLTQPPTTRGRHRWLGLAYPLAWLVLVVGIAGPRWGKSDEAGVAVGRDVVIVIDLSRSMWADDMGDPAARTRWAAARAAALDLLATIERRGGHRVAVVVFAAHAKVICPLTTDYQHVRAVLSDIDGRYPPPEIRPGADPYVKSGTRFGAALILAVETHNTKDAEFRGAQDIILISDGDDPGGDTEWKAGAEAARGAEVPVHTVGVGNPVVPAFVVLGTAENPDFVATTMQEKFLREMAAETGGEYVSANTGVPPLGAFFQREIEDAVAGGRKKTRLVSEDKLPQPKERYTWFLAPALGLFLVGWLRGR